jgi:hypothetical protein
VGGITSFDEAMEVIANLPSVGGNLVGGYANVVRAGVALTRTFSRHAPGVCLSRSPNPDAE